MTIRVAINGFGRIGRNVLRAIAEANRKDIEIVGINDLGPVETNAHLLRFELGARPLSRRGHGQGRHHQRRQRRHQSDRHQGPDHTAVEGSRRRHRHGMHRHLHRQGQGVDAPDRRRQARAGLGARRWRRLDGRLRRQPRQTDQGAQGRLQRLLHHQLSRPGRQGAQRRRRHRQGLHDDHPRLYRRPADARYVAQGPLSRPRRCAVHDPDLDRRRQGGRPGAAGACRQARRRRRSACRRRTSR